MNCRQLLLLLLLLPFQVYSQTCLDLFVEPLQKPIFQTQFQAFQAASSDQNRQYIRAIENAREGSALPIDSSRESFLVVTQPFLKQHQDLGHKDKTQNTAMAGYAKKVLLDLLPEGFILRKFNHFKRIEISFENTPANHAIAREVLNQFLLHMQAKIQEFPSMVSGIERNFAPGSPESNPNRVFSVGIGDTAYQANRAERESRRFASNQTPGQAESPIFHFRDLTDRVEQQNKRIHETREVLEREFISSDAVYVKTRLDRSPKIEVNLPSIITMSVVAKLMGERAQYKSQRDFIDRAQQDLQNTFARRFNKKEVEALLDFADAVASIEAPFYLAERRHALLDQLGERMAVFDIIDAGGVALYMDALMIAQRNPKSLKEFEDAAIYGERATTRYLEKQRKNLLDAMRFTLGEERLAQILDLYISHGAYKADESPFPFGFSGDDIGSTFLTRKEYLELAQEIANRKIDLRNEDFSVDTLHLNLRMAFSLNEYTNSRVPSNGDSPRVAAQKVFSKMEEQLKVIESIVNKDVNFHELRTLFLVLERQSTNQMILHAFAKNTLTSRQKEILRELVQKLIIKHRYTHLSIEIH